MSSPSVTVLQTGFVANGNAQAGKDNVSSATPASVLTPNDVHLTRVFPGGWGFGLGSTDTGALYCWGVNQPTLLKKAGDADDGADPNKIDLVAENIEYAAGGFDHALVILQGGKLAHFGPHIAPDLGPYLATINLPTPVKSVAAGEHHSLILTVSGDVYAFGSNREGQLGCASNDVTSITPVAVLGPVTNTPAVTAIAAGARHSVAATTEGRCLVWGWNLRGQCGTGKISPSVSQPTVIDSLGPLMVVGVAAGMGHTLILTDAGSVMACGDNTDGQLGFNIEAITSSAEPKLVEAPEFDNEHVEKVVAGARHSVALCQHGAVYVWGCGKFGALGLGNERGNVGVPKKLRDKGVTDVSAGWWHTLMAAAE